MSFESNWVLPEAIESYADDMLLDRVRSLLPRGIAVRAARHGEHRTISVDLPLARVDEIAAMFPPEKLYPDWRRDMDPPRSGGDRYDVHIGLAEDGRTLLSVYSNDGENRAAWPLVVAIASALVDELGGISEDDATPPSDRFPMFIEPGKPSKPN